MVEFPAAEQRSGVRIRYDLLTHSPDDGHLGGFHSGNM